MTISSVLAVPGNGLQGLFSLLAVANLGVGGPRQKTAVVVRRAGARAHRILPLRFRGQAKSAALVDRR